VHIFYDVSEDTLAKQLVTQLGEWIPTPRNLLPPPSPSTTRNDGRKRLTPRELDVLRLLAAGYTTEDISNELVLTFNTVRNHVQHLLEKLEVRSRLEAVLLAHRKHLL
jgi:DNA-binding NarL/FixJ family response regulator